MQNKKYVNSSNKAEPRRIYSKYAEAIKDIVGKKKCKLINMSKEKIIKIPFMQYKMNYSFY